MSHSQTYTRQWRVNLKSSLKAENNGLIKVRNNWSRWLCWFLKKKKQLREICEEVLMKRRQQGELEVIMQRCLFLGPLWQVISYSSNIIVLIFCPRPPTQTDGWETGFRNLLRMTANRFDLISCWLFPRAVLVNSHRGAHTTWFITETIKHDLCFCDSSQAEKFSPLNHSCFTSMAHRDLLRSCGVLLKQRVLRVFHQKLTLCDKGSLQLYLQSSNHPTSDKLLHEGHKRVQKRKRNFN